MYNLHRYRIMKDQVNTLKRKVKSVNGIKVNHPHSAANIFYAFFTLLLVAIPVGMLFIPLIIMEDGTKATGLEFAKALFMGMKISPDDGLNGLYKYIAFTIEKGGNLQAASNYLWQIQAGMWAFFTFLGILALVLAIVNLGKGYLTKSKAPKMIAGLMFGFGLIYSLSFLVYFLLEKIQIGESKIFIWWSFLMPGAALVLLIIMSCIYSVNFKECIYEKDLIYHNDKDDEVVTHVTEVHNVTRVTYEQATTLPPDLTSIGGHAYSQNQALIVANVPTNITSLGCGAFSNCLKLRVVSLPEGIKEIGANCFFNCASLERLNYAGTKDQWRKVKRGSNWLSKAKTTNVVCSDGALVVNPYC